MITPRKLGGDAAKRLRARVLPALVLLAPLAACDDWGSAIGNDLDQPVDITVRGVGDCARFKGTATMGANVIWRLRCSLRELTSLVYRTKDGRVCVADMPDLQSKATKIVSIPRYSETDWDINLSQVTCVEAVGAARLGPAP